MLSRKMSGRALREMREDREITGLELAGGLGVDPSLIYKIEADVRQPSARLYGEICRYFDVDKTALLMPETEQEAS